MATDSFDSDWPALMEDILASVSDALDCLNRGDSNQAALILKAIRDPVAEAVAAADTANEESTS